MPLLQKVSATQFNYSDYEWTRWISSSCSISPDIISLGSNYFIWIGIWNPDEMPQGKAGFRKEKKDRELFPSEDFHLERRGDSLKKEE
jgi:hypothetical protein